MNVIKQLWNRICWSCVQVRTCECHKQAAWHRIRRNVWIGLLSLMVALAPDLAAASSTVYNGGAPTPGTIALLLPDGVVRSNPLVTAWIDAADEEGLRIETLTDSQFLALGTGTNAYRGVILPDQVHVTASDALVTAVQGYVTRGGQAMLVFDFGALTSAGVYAAQKSRLSSLAGVDYILYDTLRDQTTGLGPIIGFESRLRQLQVPPGKSMLYSASGATPALAASTAAPTRTAQLDPAMSIASVSQIDVLKTANLNATEALYLPANAKNPGGLQGHNHVQQFRSDPFDKYVSVRTATGIKAVPISTNLQSTGGSKTPIIKPIVFDTAHKLSLVKNTTGFTPTSATSFQSLAAAVVISDPVHVISGYIYGALAYPTYVTQGTFAGLQLASSPQFGLAAGVNTVGSGKVLFVNLPLTYLKGSSDGMLMHGFLHYFGNTMLSLPHLSSVPYAQPGLTLNWHLCSNFTSDMAQLTGQGVFNNGPFSVHITAGPDTVAIGDGLGWNLPNNLPAQQMLRTLETQGHQIGNHGGWIHDYYGDNVSETNQSTFQQYLELNSTAVRSAIGHASLEYAAPQGNSPTWATNWIEQNGVTGTYSLGHTGLGPTRNYLNGKASNPDLWLEPVMPLGLYATFEEFIFYGVPKQDVNNWYKALIDFNVANRTNRLIYMHPPGAAQWSDVVLTMLNYAKTQQQAGKFRWYTIADMAYFMDLRQEVKWSETAGVSGSRQYTASHPLSLAAMSWIFPKTKFAKPIITSGTATVSDGGDGNWLVVAGGGKALGFRAVPL